MNIHVYTYKHTWPFPEEKVRQGLHGRQIYERVFVHKKRHLTNVKIRDFSLFVEMREKTAIMYTTLGRALSGKI